MPVLYRYKDKNGFYVLTSIHGSMVTFQLTKDGGAKLEDAGILPGQKFGRSLLLDLYRSGDAFTHGSGAGLGDSEHEGSQLELDFSNDSDAEKMFPACSTCDSHNDLHLVDIEEKGISADILCRNCREKRISSIHASIPLPLVSRSMLKQFLEIEKVIRIHESVTAYQQLLEAEFENMWNALIKRKGNQQLAFRMNDGKQRPLL